MKDYICPRCLPRTLPKIGVLLLTAAVSLFGCTGMGLQVREEATAVMQVLCEQVHTTNKDPLVFRIAWNLACLQVKK